jgi:hypothetical protein
MITASKLVRESGMFLLNLLLASVLPGILTSPFTHFDREALHASMYREALVTAITACGLGYFVYRGWRPVASKWVWVGGLCWFGQRAVRFWFDQRAFSILYRGHTIYWEMSGTGCDFDMQSCTDWMVYTIPFLRTIFYSLGAFCCWGIGRFGVPTILEYVLLGSGRDSVK